MWFAESDALPPELISVYPFFGHPVKLSRVVQFLIQVVDMLRNHFLGQLAVIHLQQFLDQFCGKAVTNRLRRHATYNGIGRHIFCHNRPGGNDCALADVDTGGNNCILSDPNIVIHNNVTF